MDLSIIIVSYNTRQMTLDCLKSVFEQTSRIDFEVTVVDNKSNDGSAHAIAEQFPQVRLLACEDNHGFARANNLGARQARGRYLLLLNPDTVILDCAIERLFAFAEGHPEAGIYGGRTFFSDGTMNPTCCFGRMTAWSAFCRAFGLSMVFKKTSLFDPESYGSWAFDTVKQVDIITGCFLLIRHELWRQLDGFNPTFFMYGEEVDLCLRARKLGYRPLYTPEATIIHHGRASESDSGDRLAKVLCAESTIIREHWPAHRRWWGAAMLLIYVRMKSMVLDILSLLNSPKYGPQASVWKRLWMQRGEWSRGWEPVAGL
jgi:N-acetylglucosaminyl-diphospho-decaprenol L-rhamnosyltransferase